MRTFRRIMLCSELNSIPETRKLYYTATAKVTPSESSNIVSNEWDATTGEGVIVYSHLLTTIGDLAFNQCKDLTSITIPSSVTFISRSAFSNCENLAAFYGKFASTDNYCLIIDGVLLRFAIGCGLTEYTIPDGVTSIEQGAFYDAYSLTKVIIPFGVTSIGPQAFQYCTRLVECSIPNSVTTIGYNAFYNCSDLKTLTIPESVTSIGARMIYKCASSFALKCPRVVPPTLEGILVETPSSLNSIQVPFDSVTAYKSATNWSTYASKIYRI